jgi:membrane protease YdiL (CAAX protease family)
VRVVAITTVSLAPAALAEEVAFRGFPLVVLERAVGRGTAIVALSGLFAALHAWNPGVTTLALGNIALAGVLLSLAFFAPGGIWTSWGAHLGWNASIAALDAPVSGLPFSIPFIDFNPGRDIWLTGGGFGPEGGLAATLVLGLGSVWLARHLRKDAHA